MFSSSTLSLAAAHHRPFTLSTPATSFTETKLPEQTKADALDPLQNQPCKVCDEPAAGFHFGAFTCEGCKSFFGRTCNNQSVIGECKNNYRCVVDKKNRTSCKACRLRKCLMVGMSKSGSRYGRRSNWFKIHCLMQNGSKSRSPPSLPASPSPFPPAPAKSLAWPPVKAGKVVSRSPSPPSPLKITVSTPPSPSPLSPVSPPRTAPPAPTSLYSLPPPLPFIQSASPFPSFYRLSPLLANNPFLANSILFSLAGQKHAAAAAAGLNLLQEHRALLDTFTPTRLQPHLESQANNNNNITTSPIDLSVRSQPEKKIVNDE